MKSKKKQFYLKRIDFVQSELVRSIMSSRLFLYFQAYYALAMAVETMLQQCPPHEVIFSKTWKHACPYSQKKVLQDEKQNAWNQTSAWVLVLGRYQLMFPHIC